MKLPWGPTALVLRVSLTILKISPLRVHHFKKIPQDMGCEKRFPDCQRLGVWFDCHPQRLTAVWLGLTWAFGCFMGFGISVCFVLELPKKAMLYNVTLGYR